MSAICPASRPAVEQRGFTILELLIAIVVLGIIMAIAFPSFKDSMRKSRRSEAFAALSAVQLAQERWRTNHSSYTNNVTGAWPASGTPTGLGQQGQTSSGYYDISVSLDGSGETGYDAVATAVSGSSQSADGNCVRLLVRVRGGNITYGSGAATGDYDVSANNRCWSR
jgi:type IV pilus assembly protein PilE